MGKWLRNRIRAAREASGLSQAALAAKLGVTGAAVSNWENGTAAPRDQAELTAWLESVERKVVKAVRAEGEPARRAVRVTPVELGADDERGTDDDEGSVGPSAVGEWLNKARVRAGLSVAELSKGAGVSIPAIYFIESGQSKNPRRQTLDKLQKALGGTKIDAEARRAIQSEATIEGLGVLTDFDLRAPAHRDHTKRRIVITRFAAS